MKLYWGVVLSLTAFAGQQRTLFDPDFDFAAARTFCFVSGEELIKTGVLQNPETRERIKNLIAGFLEPRGLHEVPIDEKYSVAVRYWVARKIETSTHLEPDPMAWGGYDPFWTGVWYMPYYEVTETYAVGTLIIDLLNPATKRLVWRTFLSEKMQDPVTLYKDINKDLTKAFADLPPSDGKKKSMAKKVADLKARLPADPTPKTP